jgi:hypothetical protein
MVTPSIDAITPLTACGFLSSAFYPLSKSQRLARKKAQGRRLRRKHLSLELIPLTGQ